VWNLAAPTAAQAATHLIAVATLTPVKNRGRAQSALDWSAADLPEHLWTEVELGLIRFDGHRQRRCV
jgi:hypothetical protein